MLGRTHFLHSIGSTLSIFWSKNYPSYLSVEVSLTMKIANTISTYSVQDIDVNTAVILVYEVNYYLILQMKKLKHRKFK